MSQAKEKPSFNSGLVIGLVTTVLGALLGALASYYVARWQLHAETINQVQREKLKALHDALINVARARDVAWPSGTAGHDEHDPEVKEFVTAATTFCSDFKDLSSDDLLDKRFQTEFRGLSYMVCHTKEFLVSDGTKNIPAHAYQFVDPEYLRAVAKEVDSAVTLY
jgi:hypothetical protein